SSRRLTIWTDVKRIGAGPGDLAAGHAVTPLGIPVAHLAPAVAELGDVAPGRVRSAGVVEVALGDVAVLRVPVEEDAVVVRLAAVRAGDLLLIKDGPEEPDVGGDVGLGGVPAQHDLGNALVEEVGLGMRPGWGHDFVVQV